MQTGQSGAAIWSIGKLRNLLSPARPKSHHQAQCYRFRVQSNDHHPIPFHGISSPTPSWPSGDYLLGDLRLCISFCRFVQSFFDRIFLAIKQVRARLLLYQPLQIAAHFKCASQSRLLFPFFPIPIQSQFHFHFQSLSSYVRDSTRLQVVNP